MAIPICPRQDNAPLIGDQKVFNLTWWLYFQGLSKSDVPVDPDDGISQDNVPVTF